MSEFPKKITQWRLDNDYTQENVADFCNISVRTIQSWESGQRLPGFDSLILIADTMGVSIDWLVGRSTTWQISDHIITDSDYDM